MYHLKVLQALDAHDFADLTFQHLASRLRTLDQDSTLFALGAICLDQPIGLILVEAKGDYGEAEILSLFVKRRFRNLGWCITHRVSEDTLLYSSLRPIFRIAYLLSIGVLHICWSCQSVGSSGIRQKRQRCVRLRSHWPKKRVQEGMNKGMVSEEQVKAAVRNKLFADRLGSADGTPPNVSDDNAPLFGGGSTLDSLEAFDILLKLEQEFGIRVEDHSAEELKQHLYLVNTVTRFILIQKKEG